MTGFQYAMLGIGALAALSGTLGLVMRIRAVVSGRVVPGVVVDEKLETGSFSRGELIKLSHAIYEFEHDGRTYRCVSSFGKKGTTPKGTAVRVRYLPSDPQSTAEIDSPLAIWGFPVAALAFGAIAIAVGLNAR